MDSLKWVPANAPLKAVGLIAPKDDKVIQTLLALDLERITSLRGSFSDAAIVLLGDESHLPWIPNAVYVGQLASAPNILIPTHLQPSYPLDWLGRAVERQFGKGQYALDPIHKRVFNTSEALSVSIIKLKELLNETA